MKLKNFYASVMLSAMPLTCVAMDESILIEQNKPKDTLGSPFLHIQVQKGSFFERTLHWAQFELKTSAVWSGAIVYKLLWGAQHFAEGEAKESLGNLLKELPEDYKTFWNIHGKSGNQSFAGILFSTTVEQGQSIDEQDSEIPYKDFSNEHTATEFQNILKEYGVDIKIDALTRLILACKVSYEWTWASLLNAKENDDNLTFYPAPLTCFQGLDTKNAMNAGMVNVRELPSFKIIPSQKDTNDIYCVDETKDDIRTLLAAIRTSSDRQWQIIKMMYNKKTNVSTIEDITQEDVQKVFDKGSLQKNDKKITFIMPNLDESTSMLFKNLFPENKYMNGTKDIDNKGSFINVCQMQTTFKEDEKGGKAESKGVLTMRARGMSNDVSMVFNHPFTYSNIFMLDPNEVSNQIDLPSFSKENSKEYYNTVFQGWFAGRPISTEEANPEFLSYQKDSNYPLDPVKAVLFYKKKGTETELTHINIQINLMKELVENMSPVTDPKSLEICQNYLKKCEYRKYYKKYYKDYKCNEELILDDKEKPFVKQFLDLKNFEDFQKWAVKIKKASNISKFLEKNFDSRNNIKEAVYQKTWSEIKEMFDDISIDDYLKSIKNKKGFDNIFNQICNTDVKFSQEERQTVDNFLKESLKPNSSFSIQQKRELLKSMLKNIIQNKELWNNNNYILKRTWIKSVYNLALPLVEGKSYDDFLEKDIIEKLKTHDEIIKLGDERQWDKLIDGLYKGTRGDLCNVELYSHYNTSFDTLKSEDQKTLLQELPRMVDLMENTLEGSLLYKNARYVNFKNLCNKVLDNKEGKYDVSVQEPAKTLLEKATLFHEKVLKEMKTEEEKKKNSNNK